MEAVKFIKLAKIILKWYMRQSVSYRVVSNENGTALVFILPDLLGACVHEFIHAHFCPTIFPRDGVSLELWFVIA